MQSAWVVSLVCSAVYIATMDSGGFPGRWLVKAASVAALSFLVKQHPLLATALLFGALGDALLSLHGSLFVHGLTAFLCGHILYTICFLRAPARGSMRKAGIVLSVCSAVLFLWLMPALGSLRVPVFLYILAITAMATTSFRIGGWLSVGAVLFVVSDAVLAVNRFRMPVAGHNYIIWGTYYAAQCLLASNYPLSKRGSGRPGR